MTRAERLAVLDLAEWAALRNENEGPPEKRAEVVVMRAEAANP